MKVLIIGHGRMGKLVEEIVRESDDMEIVGIVDKTNKADLLEGDFGADVAIDFSNKESFGLVEAYVKRTKTALVSGTTGFDADTMVRLAALGDVAPVIHSANYSLGVAVLKHIAAEAADALEGWDIEIVETHHNQKADAPSGTAKLLLKAVDPEGDHDAVYGREGMLGPRPAREIGVHALRGGTVAGTHTVSFFGQDEEVALTHRAQSRRIFATGAVAAARKLVEREPGFYTFDELMF